MTDLLWPAVLNLPVEMEIPKLLRDILAKALAWIKVRAATSQDLRKAVSNLEKFSGEMGELNHSIKGETN